MEDKQLFTKNLRNIVVLMLFIVILVIGVDPYNLYRDKKLAHGMQQRLLNAGLIKTYPYNTVLLGSSMTENFSMQELAENFNCRPVKLSLSGATQYEIKFLLEKAVATGKVQQAFICLDLDAFDRGVNEQRVPLPEYLYDSSYLNDYKYVFNIQAIGDSLKAVKNMYKNKYDTQDSLYAWGKDYTYSEQDVLKRYDWRTKASTSGEIDQALLDKLQANYRANLQEIVQTNPQVQFVLFFPPYSVLMYDLWAQQGKLATYLAFKSWLAQQFLQYKHLAVYDFQTEAKVITNLDNYKDYSHYKPEINSQMLQAMAREQNRLWSVAQIQQNQANLQAIIANYDYQKLFDKYK